MVISYLFHKYTNLFPETRHKPPNGPNVLPISCRTLRFPPSLFLRLSPTSPQAAHYQMSAPDPAPALFHSLNMDMHRSYCEGPKTDSRIQGAPAIPAKKAENYPAAGAHTRAATVQLPSASLATRAHTSSHSAAVNHHPQILFHPSAFQMRFSTPKAWSETAVSGGRHQAWADPCDTGAENADGTSNISQSAKCLKGITTGTGVDRTKTCGLRQLNQQNKSQQIIQVMKRLQ